MVLVRRKAPCSAALGYYSWDPQRQPSVRRSWSTVRRPARMVSKCRPVREYARYNPLRPRIALACIRGEVVVPGGPWPTDKFSELHHEAETLPRLCPRSRYLTNRTSVEWPAMRGNPMRAPLAGVQTHSLRGHLFVVSTLRSTVFPLTDARRPSYYKRRESLPRVT